jgi:4-diphosphocytidyl-2-C-methyl-D-erythritol kinase
LQDGSIEAAARPFLTAPLTGLDGGHGTTGEVGLALQLVAQAFGASRMTGSGSAVFAWAGSDAGAADPTDKLARLLATAPQDWSGRMCQGLEQHPLRAWTREGA